jgi:hypothetical protein
MSSFIQQKRSLQRLEFKRFERRLESNRKKKNRNRQETGTHVPFDVARDSRFSKGIVRTAPEGQRNPAPEYRLSLLAPKHLDLITNYDETAEFIRDVRIAANKGQKVLMDFEQSERIGPTALLALLSEIHRCRLIHDRDRVVGTYPKSPALERLMVRTGFFDLLGVKSKLKVPPSTYPVEYIRFQSDNRLDTSQPKKLREELLGDQVTMHPKARSRLFRAITEAMINVGQHAYPDYAAKTNPMKGRWWIAGHINKNKKELMVTFCDLGVGIPETLPRIYAWERIYSVLATLPGIKPDDGQMIRAGMMLGRSRTRQEHRGRGLNDLRSFIDIAGAGELYILSRKGRYRYRAGQDEEVFNSRISIGGTLIRWSVPLACVTNWVDNSEAEIDD